MKKHEFVEIYFQSFGEFKKKVTKALAPRTPAIQPENHIVFNSVSSFRSYMTPQKIEMLSAISSHRPSSIFELAHLVDRDFAAVLRDCTSLAAFGFIRLKGPYQITFMATV